jgi:hypothetical protein
MLLRVTALLDAQAQRTGSVAACLVCSNEADRLGPALASVSWTDEVVVLDLQSTDGSADVARAAGAAVHSREPYPVVEPLRDEVASHCSSEWVLVLDRMSGCVPGWPGCCARRRCAATLMLWSFLG